MSQSFIDKLGIYIFGVVVMVLLYLAADKLTQINNNIAEVKHAVQQVQEDNKNQDKDIQRHDQLINEAIKNENIRIPQRR
jgi:hypothetical protein